MAPKHLLKRGKRKRNTMGGLETWGKKKKLTALHNKNCKLKWDNGFHLSDGQRPKNGFGTIWCNFFGALLISIRLQSAHTLCPSNYTEIQKAQQSIRLREEGRGGIWRLPPGEPEGWKEGKERPGTFVVFVLGGLPLLPLLQPFPRG